MALAVAALSAFPVCAQTIDVKGNAEPFTHYWSVGVGAGRANEGLRAGWLEHLEVVKKHCGFQYVRMHGLFDDDMFVYFKKPNGKIVYNWQYIDEVYDRMLALGVKPFVELSFFPKDIAATNSKQQMWYRNNVSVDRNNFDKWHDLVKEFTQHVVDRYCIDEILTWYFEVWNEPNLNMNPKAGFFDGTKSDYFRMYKESANAIKSVDKRLKVGGPATSNFIADDRHKGEIMDHKKSVFYSQDIINTKQWKGVWIEDFLRFCEKENLPVDFISTHPYPTDYALDPDTGRSKDAIRYVHSLHDDITWLRPQIANSKYPDAEIHLTEWSTSPNSRDRMHDILPPAAYILKANLDCLGMANSLMYWTFTDVFEEKGGGEEIFHGGFGMINYQGVVKPSFHAYRMLHQLGDEKLYYNDPLFVSRFSQTGKIAAVAFNYPSEYEEAVPSAANFNNYMQASSKKVDLALKGLKPGTVFEIEILDKEHGNVYDDYLKIGVPHSPGYKEIDYLKRAAWNTDKQIVKVNSEGTLVWQSVLAPWSCVLIREL
ncbi:glycoside hydrolase [Bacteroides thetaiotaomicron]|nr:glycoside hydrolase [Bacteroides thetaiotaomicron]